MFSLTDLRSPINVHPLVDTVDTGPNLIVTSDVRSFVTSESQPLTRTQENGRTEESGLPNGIDTDSENGILSNHLIK